MVRIAPRARPWFRRALPMISIIDIVRVRGPLTIFDLGPVHDLLPWGSLVSFKVASWSMFPTIHKGDLIEIEPVASLRVGDVVVFRSRDALVCHRVRGRCHPR